MLGPGAKTDPCPDICVEVPLPGNIHANTPVLQVFRVHLVRQKGDGGDHDVGYGEALGEGELDRGDDVVRVVLARLDGG